jgi:hypothetical protein
MNKKWLMYAGPVWLATLQTMLFRYSIVTEEKVSGFFALVYYLSDKTLFRIEHFKIWSSNEYITKYYWKLYSSPELKERYDGLQNMQKLWICVDGGYNSAKCTY